MLVFKNQPKNEVRMRTIVEECHRIILMAFVFMLSVGCAEDKKSSSYKSECADEQAEISSEVQIEMPGEIIREIPEGPAPKRYGQKRTLYPYPLYGNVENIEVVDFSIYYRRGELHMYETVLDTIRFNSRGDLLEHAGDFCEGMRERYYYIYDDFGNNLLTLEMFCSEGAYNVKDPYGDLTFYISNDSNGGITRIYFDENGEFKPESLEILTGHGGYVYSDSDDSELYKDENDMYKYDEEEREIECVHYSDSGEVLNIRTTTYNSQGKKVRVVNSGPYFWIGDAYSCGGEALPDETVYSYDDNGYLIEETSTFAGAIEDRGETNVIRSEYSYDQKYNLIEVRSFNSDGDEYGIKYNIKYR